MEDEQAKFKELSHACNEHGIVHQTNTRPHIVKEDTLLSPTPYSPQGIQHACEPVPEP